MSLLGKIVHGTLRKFGYDLVDYPPPVRTAPAFPPDFEDHDRQLSDEIGVYTMTGVERQFALFRAVEYLVRNNIPGAMVECGVWKGGSMLGVARTLLREGRTDRDLYLYDTYDGMSEPSEDDVSFRGEAAADLMGKTEKEQARVWAYAQLEGVKQVMHASGYPKERMHFVVGKVEDSIPATIPDQIALLRLDTDWYESTKHELNHLWPRLSRGGVLLLDDYGHWLGARKAVDEYIAEHKLNILLNRIDYASRIAVKLD